jgi:PAS domain-containing protein
MPKIGNPRNTEEDKSFLKTVLDVLPSPVFVVDADVRILAFNAAGRSILDQEPEPILRQRSGDVLHCIHAAETPGGCGQSASCRECIIRNSVTKAFRGQKVVRQRTRLEMLGEDGVKKNYLAITTAPFIHGGEHLVLLIFEDISELLKAMLPICSYCKKIREGDTYWQSLESYFHRHHNIEFSHGLCPECARKHYPEIYEQLNKGN